MIIVDRLPVFPSQKTVHGSKSISGMSGIVRHFAFPFLGIFSRYYPILCHYAAEILIRPNDVKVNSDKGDNLIPNKGRIKPNKPFAGKPEKYIPRSIPET